MAYGKDPKALGAVGSFRQMSGQYSQNRGPKRTRGGPPYFVDMYQPSTDQADLVRLVAGEYPQDRIEGEGDEAHIVQVPMPFIKFVEHFDGPMQRGAICSAGPWANFKDKRAACHGCDIFWETVGRSPEGRLESSRISRQGKYAFSVFDYGVYHKLEQYDRETGKVKVNPTTREPYFNWVRCQGQGCDACRANKESKVGNMSHWPMSYTQLQVLRGAEADIGRSCVTCGTENCILSLGWMCRHCGECAIDMASTELKKDELLQLTDNEYLCPACNARGFLSEVYECSICSKRGHTGARATLFDVDLRPKLIEVPGAKGKVLQIMGWSAPHQIDPKFAEALKPIDLVARYAPDTLERQAKNFGIAAGPKRAPQTGETVQAPARQYANPYGNKSTQ